MSSALNPVRLFNPESADAVLAKNLVAARLAMGITQQQLAEDSRLSRATIAQIEGGSSDPRLSTIVELAKSLGLPVILLLIGLPEVRALSEILDLTEKDRPTLDPQEVARMNFYVGTGMLKDRARAAVLGAALAKSFSHSEPAQIAAAIFSGLLPGAGTEIGAILGDLLAEAAAHREKAVRDSL